MADALDFIGWNLAIAAGMAAVVWACSRTPFLRRRPSVRHGLWLLVLLKLVTPPIIVVPLPANAAAVEPVSVSETANAAIPVIASDVWVMSSNHLMQPVARRTNPISVGCCAAAPASAATVTPATTVPTVTREASADAGSSTWRSVFFACLLLSVAVTGVIWTGAVRQLVRMRRLLRRHARTSDRLTGLARDVAERFRVRSSVSIQTVDAPVAPMLWAWPGRAAILLPRELAETLDDDALRSIIAHELAHLVRRDHWTNLFALVVASLFWWNPLAWFVRRRLLTASEASCDALALERLQGSRKKYAATLLMVVDSLKAAPRQCPAFGMTFGNSDSLTRRVELIADNGVRARTSRCDWVLLTLGMAASILVPAQAEEPATPPSKAESAAADDTAAELQTFCCPTPAISEPKTISAEKTASSKAKPIAAPKTNAARDATSSLQNSDWTNSKLDRLTRAYTTFSGVGYFVESPSWSKRLHLTTPQADALLALDELVWDTRKTSRTGTEKDSDRNAREHLVLRHAEQMVKLGFFTPPQSAFVNQRQLSNPQYRRNALLHDPFFQKQFGVTVTDEQRRALIGKGADAVEKALLSEQQQLLLMQMIALRIPLNQPPQLVVPTNDELAHVKLSGTFAKLKETEKALGLSENQTRALRELERLTRLGLFWIDRRADDVVKTRSQFLSHAEQIAMLGILTAEQRMTFGFLC